jgi:restriction system protein
MAKTERSIMSIPDYQSIMLPLLQLASDGDEHKFSVTVDELADHYELTQDERNEMLPSGSQAVFTNRVGWARSYLKQAGLIDSPKRGFFNITETGLELLGAKPVKIDNSLLEQYPSFLTFKKKKNKPKTEVSPEPKTSFNTDSSSPEDSLANAYLELRDSLEAELLQIVKGASPSFFERLVVDLLVKMGYGGNRQDAGRAVGKTADGGIDGIIKEDQLGLDVIYLQAKKWENTVGRPEIQKFAGALQGQRAKRGVFITTSNFSKGAIEYAGLIESKIVLLDGEALTKLMVDNNVGVSTLGHYEVKKIDFDYFDNE